ncbi:MAG: CRISPR-associated endonuclease Cas2 [Clostridia bacterium]|nr:CRISPR-associated endonuclease Cas2 [Clostridia bacterium]MDD4387491.1 CRISPR-associated endonuclease Cas2 [Clostridia bacterium]
MILISYDIQSDKLRNKFSKFIKKYGYRLQYSVFEISNSERLLNNIIIEIKNNFEKQFTQADSVIIIKTSKNCEIIKFGYAKNEESDIIVID